MENNELTFSQKVYKIVEKIPVGQVTTYGAIATAIGRPKSARFVGFAMGNCPNPETFPWHRVVNAKGGLIPGWGEMQKVLLLAESVPFLENGNVDMKKCFWTPKFELEN